MMSDLSGDWIFDDPIHQLEQEMQYQSLAQPAVAVPVLADHNYSLWSPGQETHTSGLKSDEDELMIGVSPDAVFGKKEVSADAVLANDETSEDAASDSDARLDEETALIGISADGSRVATTTTAGSVDTGSGGTAVAGSSTGNPVTASTGGTRQPKRPRDKNKANAAVRETRRKRKEQEEADEATRIVLRLKVQDLVNQIRIKDPDFAVNTFVAKDYPPDIAKRTHDHRPHKRETAVTDEERLQRQRETNCQATRRAEARKKWDADQKKEEILFLKKQVTELEDRMKRMDGQTVAEMEVTQMLVNHLVQN